jgi:hypothetical protein
MKNAEIVHLDVQSKTTLLSINSHDPRDDPAVYHIFLNRESSQWLLTWACASFQTHISNGPQL